MKKFAAILVAFLMLFSMSSVAYAGEVPQNNTLYVYSKTCSTDFVEFANEAADVKDTPQFTFLDSEGKENTLETNLLADGHVVTKLYIEGKLIATTTTQYNAATRQLHINRVAEEGNSFNQTVPISTFISEESSSPIPVVASANSSFDYEGRINYKPYFGEYLRVSVYTDLVNARQHYKTFFGSVGTAVDVLIGGLASYFASLHPELAGFASTIGGALLVSAGAVVVAGIIRQAFVQEYLVKDWTYDVKTVASDSGAEQIYHANHAYQFYLEGDVEDENLSDIIRFDYLEWDDNGVAIQFFSDFWGVGNCPGVQSYTYA